MRRTNASQALLEITGSETLEPSPDILDALKRDYPLHASIADLVDNSIDAGASRVLIRFIRDGQALTALTVADNGKGMSDQELRRAMTFAKKRAYKPSDLGMFGVGLKTASLSLADTLTVLTRAKGGKAVGRQWTSQGIKKGGWRANIVSRKSAEHLLNQRWGPLGRISHGTLVRWDDVHDFQRIRHGVEEYLEKAIRSLRLNLGLRLHRFLEKGRLKIQIEVGNADGSAVGPPSAVLPLDPFPSTATRASSQFPKRFVATLPGRVPLTLIGHVWRKKSRDDGYRLGGGRVAEHQGLYFYRHDRLIQDGGWNGIIGTNEPHLSLARVAVDIPDALATYLQVRSNKSGVDVPASFPDAILAARGPGGATFKRYLEEAEEIYRRRGVQLPRPMLAPGDGLLADVRRAIQAAGVPLLKGRKCDVLWGRTKPQVFCEIDQDERAVVINERFRPMLLRNERGGATDLPLVRTLLYFVFESTLAGERLGAVERARVNAICGALVAALRADTKKVQHS